MTEDPIDFARRYLAAIESGATGDELAAFFTEDAVQEELPNRLSPEGASRDRAGILEAAERGKAVLSSQRYELLSAMNQGRRLALEVAWSGVLAVPIGERRPGDELRARFAVFIELDRGKIRRQRNYDCFEPF